jgi:hypothetical protein
MSVGKRPDQENQTGQLRGREAGHQEKQAGTSSGKTKVNREGDDEQPEARRPERMSRSRVSNEAAKETGEGPGLITRVAASKAGYLKADGRNPRAARGRARDTTAGNGG